ETLYGEGGGRFIFALGADDVFHTPYFIALEVWAALSLFACAVNRLRTAWKSRSGVGRDFAAQRTLKLPGEPKRFLLGIQGRLKRDGWRVADLDGGAIYASRGGWARWASPALHLGIVLLLIAGLVKLVAGESAYLVLFENQGQLLPPRLGSELEVTATGFDTVVDPNSGRVLTYYTELSVHGPEGLESPRIEVNAPYSRGGLSFYQTFVDEVEPALLLIGSRGEISSYVERRLAFEGAPLVIESVELRLRPIGGELAGEAAGYVELGLYDEPSPYPGSPWSVLVLGYYPNHQLGSEPGVDLNTNPEPNPAMRLDLYLEGAPVVENALVYRLHPDFLDPKLAAAGVGIELGRVRWSRNPEPVLPRG
ncbi:cytochrome c biogenesis protein ResB, partial [bacterium]|nr:cytochrome c biogenesis protein ResB [bacterium]